MRFFASFFLLLSVFAHALRAQEIAFADMLARRICLERWDRNGDGRMSVSEAAAVSTLGGAFSCLMTESPQSLHELRYFTRLTELGHAAFTDCYHLQAITLPPALEVVSSHAFWSCLDLRAVEFPPTVRRLEFNCFYHCTSLKEISTPTSLRDSIPFQAFAWCTDLRQVVIGEGPDIIGPFAFYECGNLRTVSLPSTIRKICIQAFGQVPALRRLCLRAAVPPRCEEDAFSSSILRNTALYVPAGSVQAYKTAPGWRDFRLIVELVD